MRVYRSFAWKDTNLRVASPAFDLITRTVIDERRRLERYIARHPDFLTSLVPVVLLDDAPEVAQRMAAASALTGLGPMAAVAGTLAQMGAEAAMAIGCPEAIVENGGDIYIHADSPVTIGIYAGDNAIAGKLAFRLDPATLPLALCSSSSKMGHSLSFGRCDLATVVAKDAALADSAVTLVCNLIKTEKDLTPVLDDVGAIAGIDGILAVKNGKIGLWGRLPELVRNQDTDSRGKITRDLRSDFQG
ncbi:ApbE family lipoprotein [Desulfobulbus propionicus DSM 2032]|uniref:ApbE family lipoprotein n=1 Tax=Desulfobulbus propionicus (strain ATCC 33891 / DSM 2032 / VKM B-1956 / 1pr3) TaxID=577650 RepID=A0A7U3YPW4_DESPD|nr:UPF0280 family protein [Desulfobulbus propionicus]ADW19368.1 ApbE family lipoprotein [Desulfobulbus propionicus DSM 2032]